MADSAPARAASAAEASLLALCAAVSCLIPPFNVHFVGHPALLTLLGLAIASSLVLHLVFVGLLARAHGRSAAGYVALALVTLPIGSIVGLVLVEWHHAAARRARADGTA